MGKHHILHRCTSWKAQNSMCITTSQISPSNITNKQTIFNITQTGNVNAQAFIEEGRLGATLRLL